MDQLRLRRPWFARALGGNPFQLYFVIVFVLFGGLYLGLAVSIGVATPSIGTWVTLAIVLAIWLLGVTATATADDEGLRWRYWRGYSYRWVEVESVELTSRVFGYGDRAAIIVTANGRQHRLSPASECGRERIRFGGALVALAERHGVATRINSADPRWNGAQGSSA